MKTLYIQFITIFLISSISIGQDLFETKSFNSEGLERIRMKVSGADIEYRTWNQPTVEIKLYLVNASRSEQEAFENDYDRFYDLNGSEVYIELEKRGKWNWGGRGYGIKYKVYTPKTFEARLSTSGGDVDVSDLTGILNLSTSGGDIDINNISGQLQMSTSGGDINILNSNGPINASTSGGDISARNLMGDIKLSTSGGDVEVFKVAGRVDASTSGGDVIIEIIDSFDGIKAATSGGDIEITIPKNIQADLYLKTSGERVRLDKSVENDFSGEQKKNKVSGRLNGGGPEIYGTTSGGDIRLSYR